MSEHETCQKHYTIDKIFKNNSLISHMTYLLSSINFLTIPLLWIINFNCSTCMSMTCEQNLHFKELSMTIIISSFGSLAIKFLLLCEKIFIGTKRTVTKNYSLLIEYVICSRNGHMMVILFVL